MCSGSSDKVETLLSEALAGSVECLGQLLEHYRNYLKFLVVSQLESRIAGRMSPSDVVQETFLEANRDFSSFRGASPGEFTAWLRRILINNLHRAVEQHVTAGKRDVRREVSLEGLANGLEHSVARLEAILPDPGMSPSGEVQRHELEIALASEIAELPSDYRDVIVMRHIEGLSFDAVGERMNRSTGAARMLWLRAIEMLRERMTPRGNHD